MWQIRFLIYLFEVSASSLAFFLLYILLLKNLTFFKHNRIYLIFALMCSFAIPLAKIELQSDVVHLPSNNKISDKVEELTTLSSSPIVNSNLSSINTYELLFYVYMVVAALLLIKGLSALVELFKSTRKVNTNLNGLKVIYKYSGFVNCSFFNYVFINPLNFSDKETEMLLQHEYVHAKQWHSADKIFLLFCKSILWFNPLIYLYDKELEKVHEFEADATTLNSIDIKAYAQFLIRLASHKTTNALTHSFGKHPIKKRIEMLFTNRSKAWSSSAYAFMIPLFLVLISAFSIKLVATYPVSKSAFTLILDPGHGGSDDGGSSGTINEKQLTLTLVKKIRSMAESNGLNVIITRGDDSNVTLKQRGSIKGDVLLSIHHNASTDKSKNGIEIISGTASIPLRRSVITGLTSSLYENLRLLSGINTENISKEVTGSYILEKSTAPSIMLELGYLTNELDKAFLTNPAHQNELANAIVNSVLAYQNNVTPH